MTVSNADRYDVIIAGYGYAGAFAAIAAADCGARVLILEKAAQPGGISICSAGGLRTAADADLALDYLEASCGGKTPGSVLRQLAEGMTTIHSQLSALAQGTGARIENRHSPANYPFPGFETFGFCYVETIDGFDPASSWPHVRGAQQGALLFRLLEINVEKRHDRIDVRLATPVARLLQRGSGVNGVELFDGTGIEASGGVVLACGGFEACPAMQSQYWPGGPALSAAYCENTGDGIRMAQAAGADLWHMWHWHGCYGYRLPQDDYPFGVRVKRFPDWTPDKNGDAPDGLPVMPWILLDRSGRRFMNEYEPYVQDTGGRSLGHFDPARQRHDRNPAWMVTDAAGLAMYPLGKPTRNDLAARYDWSQDNAREVASGLFRKAANCAELANLTGTAPDILSKSLEDWSAACGDGQDGRFGRPASSLHALVAPYWAALVEPVVSNTQGGPVHDAEQRVLTPGGEAIAGLFAAGECGSAFGHLYMSGGNLAECCVGGGIAGTNAAAGRMGG
jgi:succinate dehydrogenase/fumarate reductase flavoprotein subunit